MPEVVALYKYSYVYEGKTITFKKGEKFQLLDKPNGDWWHVRRWQDSGAAEDIYVPANYVKEAKEETTNTSPLYENMSDLAASYKKTKEGITSGEGKKEKCLPPPVRQKPTRASVGDRSTSDGEKAANGHIPRQGKKTPAAAEQSESSGLPRKGSEGDVSSPKHSHRQAGLPVVAMKPRSKSTTTVVPSDEGMSNLDRVESVLDRLPPGTTARLLNSAGPGGGGAGGGEVKQPPPSVKPKPGRHQQITSQQDSEQEAVASFKPMPAHAPGEVPSDVKKPSKFHSYEAVLPVTKTPSPDTVINKDTSSTALKV